MLKLTELEWVTIITVGIPATGAFLTGVINHSKIGRVQQQVDGRLTQLLELTKSSSFAAGQKNQKDYTEPHVYNIVAEKSDGL
jgi:hypothetical protein